ncbi:von Willebrand factor A domain-containing protein 5B1 isoform X3 [Salminus brasiliensis]|uniref:von Willebrand factor A domain-containing protein 5B1 isoform X3 n=1 Tax=Salminus brasiliensis TaxID=930266 RepID=UPI003B832431
MTVTSTAARPPMELYRPAVVLLDEDLERRVLVVNLGVIPPLETVNVLVSTSSELSTLPNGGIRVTSPPVCSPRVQRSIKEEQAFSPSASRKRDRHHCTLGSHEQIQSLSSQLCLAWLLEEESINSIDYEFNFQLEIRGPYLLAGVESPSHAIRADADPSARSATSIVVTLADKYTYDCPVEIIIYPSEPHLPHVLIEDGDMTLEEYDEHLKGRSDYIKATKKDSSNEKKVDIIHKRLHKDILHNPVVMLNFCPDLQSMTSDLRRVQGEFIFLIDRSGSMSGVNISRVKDAMVVILKSLFPACMFNIIGFGSTFKTLFATSQSYDEESLAAACEYMRKIRADMGGTNLLAPLNWILRQPVQRGHPRLLFLLTDGAVNNTGKVIELVRSHARFTRCYTFGIGQGACRRLIEGLSAVSRGTAEFLAEGERLQPKMIKCLKKSMAPVLSDISIEWLYPETKEVLLSPVGTTYLFPGDRLIGYSVVCDTTRYHANPKSDKRRRYSMMRSNESASSVFYHSQEEEPGKSSSDGQAPPRDTQGTTAYDPYQSTMCDSSPLTAEQEATGADTSMRRRAYSTNQIEDYNPLKKVYTPSDPSSAVGKNPLRRAKVQELIGQTSPDYGAQWKVNYQPQLASLCAASSRGPSAMVYRPPPQTEGPHSDAEPEQTQPSPSAQAAQSRGPNKEEGSRSSTDSPSLGSVGEAADGYTHQLCEAETPQDPHTADFKAMFQGKGDCKAVVSGLLCGKPVKWEVTFDIDPYLKGREREEKVHEDLWNETFHHLAARSIIQDFEQMADKECEIEHSSGRRYQLYAMQTSKACNILSKYTAFVPIDLDSNEYLPTSTEYFHTGDELKRGSHSSSCSGSRKSRGYSVGLGRSQSGHLPEEEDKPLLSHEDGTSPCSTPTSAGWERCTFPETSQRSPSVTSDHSQRSVESLFSARLSLTRTRLLTKAARGFMCRAQSKTSDSVGESDNDNKDYIRLVSLQLSCGAFLLDSALCEAINVPMDKLKWTSPFTSHRVSLTHPSHHSSSSKRTESLEVHHSSSPPPRDIDLSSESEEAASCSPNSPSLARSPRTESSSSLLGGPGSSSLSTDPPLSPSNSQADSGRGSESENLDTPQPVSPGGLRMVTQEPESMVWATAVALAWLENNLARYFIEWELIAAKASLWLDQQAVPEGRDLAVVKAAANQLFIILRHWDENLQLNMLCYNPNSV